MTRAFVALLLPEPAADRIAAIQAVLRQGRPIDPGALHLTLAFLGDQRQDRLDELAYALSALHAAAPSVRLEAPEVLADGRVLALMAAPNPALDTLRARVLRAARAAGIAPERQRFRPHVSIARLTRAEAPGAAGMIPTVLSAQAQPIEFDANELALMSSILHPDGARYEPIVTTYLGPSEHQG